MTMISLDRRHLLAGLGAGLIATPRVFAGSSAEQIGTGPKESLPGFRQNLPQQNPGRANRSQLEDLCGIRIFW